MDINDPNIINEDLLPSVKNFMGNESNLPSINDFISVKEENLPSYDEFVEIKEEAVIEEETHEPVDSEDDSTRVIVSLIESLRNSIPEVKSYDKELYELMNCIEEVRKDIPDVPEVKYYDEQISELQESIQEVRKDIPQVPEVKYYDSEISELKNSIQEVKDNGLPDFRWIARSFDNVSDDYEKLNSLLARFKGNFDLEISNIVESIGVSKFESDTGLKRVNEELVSKVEETREIIHTRLKETSKNILSMKKEYKNSDKQLREEIKKEYLNMKEDISKSLQTLNDFDDSLSSKIDQVNSYFETLKHEVENLPEVKYYDEEIKNVNDSVKTVENLIEILEEKLNKKISSIEESILVSNEPEEIKEDPLTPLDQNFATLNDLSNHYRLFINRIQQQLSTLGGGGETRLEFLDDVDRNSAKVDGKALAWDQTSGKFIGTTISTGIAGIDTTGTSTFNIINASTATFSGNISVAGTITYEDVTNVDSIGIVTARTGINVLANGINVSGVSTFQSHVHLGDDDELRFGASNDFKIVHDPNDCRFENSNGDIKFKNTGSYFFFDEDGGETLASFINDGAVNLFYSGNKKFETTGAGATVFGTTLTQQLNVSGVSTFQGNVNLGDNDQIIMGDGPDLKLYHDGSNSYVEDTGTGALIMKGSTVRIRSTTNENMLSASQNGAISLYHDNNVKLETTSTGVDITGHTETDTLNVSDVATFQGGLVEKFQTGTTLAADNTLALSDGNVIRRTDNESGNQTVNFTGVHSTLSSGQVVSFTVIITPNGSGVINAVQIDGQTITIKWSGGSVPSAGSSGKDVYTFSVFKTGTGVSDYEVYGAATNYA